MRRRGCPLPQKASENSSKNLHPVCDQRGSGLPSTSVLACDSAGEGGPSSEGPQPCHVGPLLRTARPRPGGRPDLLLCQTPLLPAGPPCTVAMAILPHVSRACCSCFISLRGQSHFREAPGAARQQGDSPEAPRGPGPRPGLDPCQQSGSPGWPWRRWEPGGGQGCTVRTEIKQPQVGAGAPGPQGPG